MPYLGIKSHSLNRKLIIRLRDYQGYRNGRTSYQKLYSFQSTTYTLSYSMDGLIYSSLGSRRFLGLQFAVPSHFHNHRIPMTHTGGRSRRIHWLRLRMNSIRDPELRRLQF